MTAPKVIGASIVDASNNYIRVDFDQPIAQDSTFYDTHNWSVDNGRSVDLVQSDLGTSSALLVLDDEMTTNLTYIVTVSNVTNEAAEIVDPSFAEASFEGQGVHPWIVSVAATGPTTITIEISESVQTEPAETISKYTITSPIGASQVTPTSIDYNGATTVLVHLNREMTIDAAYSITIDGSAFVDSHSNAMTTTAANGFLGVGVKPQVASAAIDEIGLVVTFDEDMYDETALVSRLNYIIVCNTPGAAAAFVKSVKRLSATQVRLEISETTTGASYTVVCGNVRDVYFNSIDTLNNDANFTGAGTTPRIVMVRAVGPNRVDVHFSEPMFDSADLRDTARYVFTNGLSVLSAMPSKTDSSVVQLVTSEWVAGVEYALTITAT